MDAEVPEPETSDDEFLDRAFERAVAFLEQGSVPSAGELLAGREHLRTEVEHLLLTARQVTPIRGDSLPTVRGFTLLEELGRGGMGAVFLARQHSLGGRRVALKVLPAGAGLSARARERFLAEARTIAGLRHSNVVTIHDVVAEDDVHAYSMEWVDGVSLGKLIDALKAARGGEGGDADGASPDMSVVRELRISAVPAGSTYPLFVCRLGIAIARALSALHQAGLVHRDVKPANILLRRDGTPLLSDFGLVHESGADLTHSGEFVGTLAYASPEQISGDPESLDARSDVYALGVTLYQALTLHLPFDDRRGRERRPTTPAGMQRLIERDRASPLRTWNRRLPRDLETILAKAIEPEPARRYASAAELADELERMLSLQPIRARRSGWFSRGHKLLRRNRAAALGLGAGSLVSFTLAAAAVVYAFVLPRWAAEHAREARLLLIDPDQANTIISIVFWGETQPLALPTDEWKSTLSRALREYDAALRLAPSDAVLRRERATVAAAMNGSAIDSLDDRTLGLHHYLSGDFRRAIESWSRWEAQHGAPLASDPLVESALGVLHLANDEPALAYPRLCDAVQAFPDVGFLLAYLADAALQCGDLEAARQLVVRARGLAQPDPMHALERVEADLAAVVGREEEALRLYESIVGGNSVARFHRARLLEVRNDFEGALRDYRAVLALVPTGRKSRAAFLACAQRWWTSQPLAERSLRIRGALDEPVTSHGSFAGLLRDCLAVGEVDVTPTTRATIPGVSSFFRNSTTPAAVASSSSCETLSLPELARRMEVLDMPLWSTITKYPSILKDLHSASWRWQALAPLARAARPAFLALASLAAASDAADAQGPAHCPGHRVSYGLAYDVNRGVTVLFGGADETGYLSGTWEWDGALWTQRIGTQPSPRAGIQLAYDSARAVSVLFGGSPAFGVVSSETWEWNGKSWSLRSNSGPAPREDHALAYDSARGVTVLFSGLALSAGVYNNAETWEWNGASWTQRFPAISPPPRVVGRMTYDSARGVCVLVGGYHPPSAAFRDDTWEWDGNAWTQRMSAHRPPMRGAQALAYDAARSVTVLNGGYGPANIFYGDMWEWDGVDWTQVATGPSPARSGTNGVVDTARGQFLFYGGVNAGVYRGDTWEFASPSSGWSQVGLGPDDAPIARAGADQSVAEGAAVVLDGARSASCDLLSYAWTQIAGPSVTLDTFDPARPIFTAPFVPIGGATLTFQLVVNDATRTSAPDVVNVVVSNVNHPPVALAGDDQIVAEVSPVALDGSNSFDPDDDPLSYTWSQVGGPAVALDLTNPIRPTFTAPLVGAAGDTLVFQLTLSDTLDSASDSVAVHVDNVNHLPTADAGADQTRAEGVLVTLDASASQDPDSDTLSYAWSQIGGPTVALANANTSAPSFTVPQVGALGALLVFRVNVDDGYGGTAFDDVQINVQDSNAGPSCALARSSVAEIWPPNHKLVAISILGVTDPENDAITIRYLGVTQDEPIYGQGDGDTGPDAVVQGNALLLRAERSGTGNGRVYRVTFEADDGHGGVCSGTVNVCVPHSKGKNAQAPVDDGQIHNSLGT